MTHLTARVKASVPPKGTVLVTGTAVIEFWPPGADTSGPPLLAAPAEFDFPTRSWIAVIDDTDMKSGTWTARASVEGAGPQGPVASVSPWVTFTLG
jgi:hypothetical protein